MDDNSLAKAIAGMDTRRTLAEAISGVDLGKLLLGDDERKMMQYIPGYKYGVGLQHDPDYASRLAVLQSIDIKAFKREETKMEDFINDDDINEVKKEAKGLVALIKKILIGCSIGLLQRVGRAIMAFLK